MTEETWRPIRDGGCPINETVLAGNENTGDVFPAYAYWGNAPFPLWCSLSAEGMGRCRPTHWQPLPKLSLMASRDAAA